MSAWFNADGSITQDFSPGYPTRYVRDPGHWDPTGSFLTLSAAEYAAWIQQLGRMNTSVPPVFVVSNPGKGVEAPNAEIPFTKNADGSSSGRIPGTSVVVNLPKSVA
jgi:hypothetical protein